MILKLIKRLLIIVVVILAVFCIAMLIPRSIGILFPDKKPAGYHFVATNYLAVKTGLEKPVNLTPPIPEDIEEIKNIEYKNIDGKSLQLDIYRPKNINRPLPLLVFIHGGSWKSGKRSDYLVYLVDFAKRGYVTATVSYRLLKDGPYPACVEDVTGAVRWFFKNGEKYGYDPDRIALIGGSAGSHLALLAAYGWKGPADFSDIDSVQRKNHKVKAVVDIYGPIDLTTEYAREKPQVVALLAHTYQEAPDLFAEASPLKYIDENDPPTLIFHGTSDELVPVSQSDTLKAGLDRLGVPCVYHRLPLWPHTMDVVKRVNDYFKIMMNDFFKQYLF
ncbi:MAG TPA: alpha/beta hydrolase [Bacteroidales bacterium]|nr:alpha/beta hydrolase [Bacteroidales bacterium]HPF02137.1 alpha/beta hydrolase [Bacteroidales bacterium]HPJ58138.1 alpha/beta hydrolase [Bacteroidales bacterium]HPR11469.1 alpha/beta hydrolase [Bacteroidales bacterium]HRW84548.1 alpha/beta hydrolase [Bacteroidales bacterium]